MKNVWEIAGAFALAALTGAAFGLLQSADADAAKVVGIDNFTFGPPKLTVAVGTTVTWANHDDIPHTVVSSPDPKIFKSSALDTDDKFSFTFTKAGTFKYFCSIHPKMVGTVIVK